METTRTNVRKYFLGQRKLTTILIIVGILLCLTGALAVVGIILIVVGIVLMFVGNHAGQEEVDQALRLEMDRLSKRGVEKLNVISEQISSVDPIYLFGPGAEPDASMGVTAAEASGKKTSWWKKLFSGKGMNDPVVAYRIGSDEKLRYMLLQCTVYAFSEEELLVYSGNVDISTGKIYGEETVEIFYKDIAGIATGEVLFKVYNKKARKFVYKLNGYATVQGNGVSYTASLNTDIGDSAVDNQFAGMRSLIREKKHEA